MNDYERMAAVIRFLDQGYRQQPTLADLASAAGLSTSHFHRLFVKWIGVTPKDFVQCLTAEHAKGLLRKGASVLDAALDSGLSGPGRLHDLCVTLEAASPGELKSGGLGLAIRYGYASSPFGDCLVAQTARGLCLLSFVERPDPDAAEALLAAEWPAATISRDDRPARALLAQIFTPVSSPRSPLRAIVRGSEFQVQVWRALLRIAPGSAISYGRLAAALGDRHAARAVGNAVGANPIALLVPCHRVIRESGAVGPYRWGHGRKRALLAWESAQVQASLLDGTASPL
jgi:AraC family transcriptional regulator of adaptative response/methylated-DNA-[protein]-cysteine methyltransferase